MYIKPERVLQSFLRLRMRSELGEGGLKRGQERTSALSVFLAYDMTRKSQEALSLDPDDSEGRRNRSRLGVAFSKILLLRNLSGSRALATSDFGEVRFCPTPKQMPESKLTDNFLSTRLKTAADQGRPLEYPQRPPGCPLLLLGPAPGSSRWTVGAHPAWWDNFPRLLADRRSNTIFLDLAVFLLRDTELQVAGEGLSVVEAGLRSMLSDALATRMTQNIRSERLSSEGRWLAEGTTWLQSGYSSAFDPEDFLPPTNEVERLRAYIRELQSALDDFDYQYAPTPD